MWHKIRQIIGSLIFTAWFFLSVVGYAIGVLLCAPFGYGTRYRLAMSWSRVMMRSLRVLCRIDYEVHGLEHVPDSPCVFLIKHSSALETVAEIDIFGPQTWVLKRELQWIPIFGWALLLLKPIGINRSGRRNAVKQVIRLGSERLAEGINVMIFPEGTRVPHGQTRRYGSSGAALAKEAKVPLIPVAHNAGVFWPRRGVMKFPGKVEFVVGQPVWVGEREPREVNEEIQAWIEGEISKMAGREARH